MDEQEKKPAGDNSKRPLTIDEIAEYLQRSRGTIYNYMNKGMPHTQVGGGPRFNADEVMEWWRNRPKRKKQQPTQEKKQK